MYRLFFLAFCLIISACNNNDYRPLLLEDYPYKTIDEATPSVFSSLAEKVTNKLLDKTPREILTQDKKINIVDIRILDEEIPDGFYYSMMNIEKIVEGSTAFKVVGPRDNPDYFLEPKIAKIKVDTKDEDVKDVIYQLYLGLYDKDGNVIESTSDGYRQIFEDKSWW